MKAASAAILVSEIRQSNGQDIVAPD